MVTGRKHGSRPKAGQSTSKRSNLESTEDELERGQHVNKKVRWEQQRNQDEGETEEECTSEDAVVEKTCLTGWSQHGRVGFAYYDPVKCVIYTVEDTEETAHYDLTKMVLEQAAPDIMLTSVKSDDRFIDIVREYMETTEGIFQIRPYKEFMPAKGKDRLLSLPFLADLHTTGHRTGHRDNDDFSSDPSEMAGVSRNASNFMERQKGNSNVNGDPTLKRWNASIRASNFTSMNASPLCISSAGALLDHLVRERAVNDLEDEGIRGLEVRDIESFSLNATMQINSDALASLQIFESESHASVHSDQKKEGLSLYGVLNNTKTSLGKALLRTWLLRPSLSLPVIKSRHDAVGCFVLPENALTVNSLHAHLKGIKNVPRILVMLRAGKAKVFDWQGLVKFTFHCALLKDSLMDLHQAREVPIVTQLLQVLDIATFREVGNKINETIDWDESSEAGRVCVRSNVDEELDNRKHVYYGIDSVLSKVAEQICHTVSPEFTTTLNVVYFPQLGFLICVPMLDEWKTKSGIQVAEGWIFQFSSESHVYFKSQEMNDMDAHIGDLHSLIVDREIEIIQVLLDEILEHDASMSRACDVCAELDCLLSFADAARAHDYRRPDMVEANVLEIFRGRHPLQELVVDSFVPNDIRVAGGRPSILGSDDGSDGNDSIQFNSIILCTGANACGKSVYLKQVALIQYMAQIGCFVAAEHATLGVVDKIYTRINTRESASKIQSAFMIDLNQVSLALRNSTARSLILLDEFGKGSLSTDGAGLLCGVLKHLLDRGSNCPKVLVATHFHDVFRDDILDVKTMPISFVHMEIMFTSEDEMTVDDTISSRQNTPASIHSMKKQGPVDKITYLYRVAEGIALESHAAKCAEVFGLPGKLVERAQYVSELIANHEISKLLDEEMGNDERRDLEDAEGVCRRFIAWKLEEETDRVKDRLGDVLGRTTDDTEWA